MTTLREQTEIAQLELDMVSHFEAGDINSKFCGLLELSSCAKMT